MRPLHPAASNAFASSSSLSEDALANATKYFPKPPTATSEEKILVDAFLATMTLLIRVKPIRLDLQQSIRNLIALATDITAHPGFIVDTMVIARANIQHASKLTAMGASTGAYGGTSELMQRSSIPSLDSPIWDTAQGSPFPDLARQIIKTFSCSEEQFLQDLERFGVPAINRFGASKFVPTERQRHNLRELVPEARKIAQDLHALDFDHTFRAFATNGLCSLATKSDVALLQHIDWYTSFAKLSGEMVSACVRPELLGPLHSSLKDPSLFSDAFKTIAQTAISAVSARLTESRTEAVKAEALDRALKERKAAVALLELEREQAAVARREEQRRAHVESSRAEAITAFHSTFQPSPIPLESQRVIEQLGSGHGIPHAQREAALRVSEIASCLLQHLFDYRGDSPLLAGDPSVAELAGLVFSPSNLGMAAKAFQIDAQKCLNVFIPAKSPIDTVVRRTSELFNASPACRRSILTMLDQSDGILLLATLLLPAAEAAAYARSRKWDSPGTNAQGVNIRAPLAERLRRVIEDGIVLKSAREILQQVEQQPPPSKPLLEIPSWVEEIVNRAEFAYSLEGGQVLVALREEPSAALFIPAKFLQDKTLFQKEFKFKLDELLSRLEVERLITRLRVECGFEETRKLEADGIHVSLAHRAYEIDELLSGLPKKWTARLEELRHRFLQHEKSWEVLLSQAEAQGFSVERGIGGTILRHKLLGDVPLSAGPYIPLRKLPEASTLLEAARLAERKQLEAASRSRNALERAERAIRRDVLPLHGEDILVVDSNVFMALSAPRAEGGTWLDLLQATAALPNVRLVIPAIVADFELLSRVAPFGKEAESPLSGGFKTSVMSDEVSLREFLKDASRLKIAIGPDGLPRYERGVPGANRHVCIVESPGDDAFYGKMHTLFAEVGGNRALFYTRVREEVFGRGVGDDAITRFIQSCPFPNRIMVVTSDIRYSRHRMPRTTPLGQPVSACSIGTYVAAECGLRGEELRERLKAPKAVHFHSIAESVNEHMLARGKGNFYLFTEAQSGQAASNALTRPASIEEIISQGLSLSDSD